MNITAKKGVKQYNGIFQKLEGNQKGGRYRVVVTARSESGNPQLESIVWTQPGTNGREPQFNGLFPLTKEYQTFYYEFDSYGDYWWNKDMILHIGGIGGPYVIDIAEAYLEYIGEVPLSPSVGVTSVEFPIPAQELKPTGGGNYRLPGASRLVEPPKTEGENIEAFNPVTDESERAVKPFIDENEEAVNPVIDEDEEADKPVLDQSKEKFESGIDEDEQELIPNDEITLPAEGDKSKPENLEPGIDKEDELVNPEQTKNGINDELNNDKKETGLSRPLLEKNLIYPLSGLKMAMVYLLKQNQV